MSPSSEDASKIDGVLKTKVAVPFVPSLDRVKLTSGIDGSLIPFMNCISAAMHVRSRAGCSLPRCLATPASAGNRRVVHKPSDKREGESV